MTYVQAKEEDVREAYEEGDEKEKKLLKKLFPDAFKIKFPCIMKNPNTGLIVFIIRENDDLGEGWVLKEGILKVKSHFSNQWEIKNFVPIKYGE